MNSAALLAARGLVAGYRPDLPILNGASLHVGEREIVTVIGPNGAGKSTLIKAIAGLVAVTSGAVVYRGEDITGRAPHRLAGAGIAYVPQTGNIFTTLSVRQNLALAGHTLASRRAVRARAGRLFEQFPDLAAGQRADGRGPARPAHVVSGDQGFGDRPDRAELQPAEPRKATVAIPLQHQVFRNGHVADDAVTTQQSRTGDID